MTKTPTHPKKRGKKKTEHKTENSFSDNRDNFFELRFLFYLLKTACYSHIIYPTYSSLSFYWNVTNSQFYLQYVIVNTLVPLPTSFSIRSTFCYLLRHNRVLWENNKLNKIKQKLKHHNRTKFSYHIMVNRHMGVSSWNTPYSRSLHIDLSFSTILNQCLHVPLFFINSLSCFAMLIYSRLYFLSVI